MKKRTYKKVSDRDKLRSQLVKLFPLTFDNELLSILVDDLNNNYHVSLIEKINDKKLAKEIREWR